MSERSKKRRTVRLQVSVEVDASVSPEAVERTLAILLDTALSSDGIRDEIGDDAEVGAFEIIDEPSAET
jgi:hypothetical protein